MARRQGEKTQALEVSAESRLLRQRYEQSGLTIAELAAATDLSEATVTVAVAGFRYRDGQPIVVAPTDRTLVQLAPALRIGPEQLRAVDRVRAAELLEAAAVDIEGLALESSNLISASIAAQAAASARRSLMRSVLAVFSTDDLRDEIALRENGE
ncbi:hypothetical protein PYV02_01410 [Leifsonia sp. H3M29-4]|uniref:hypothetical protein n=1 Tax=Salinibacterium metalliresistens TaxID=3031321 RepID=UPI0023DB34E0|nr:hypothetical protein [Salinibacterium metalliresistens]MDF1477736.1 hypothetical protein [Salinibacterium metalliresistens]